MMPVEENMAKWEIIDQDELDKRIDDGLMEEGCKLYKIEKEINVSFETVVHLD